LEDVENARKEALDLLRTIQTLEDVKEHDQEIVDLMVGFYTAYAKSLGDWFEEILKLDPNSKKEEVGKFEEKASLADEELDKEIDRIRMIPGSDEHMDPFMEEFAGRVNPQMDKTQEMMMKLIADLGAYMMGTSAGGMGGEEGLSIEFQEGGLNQGDAPPKIEWGNSFNSDDPDVRKLTSNMSGMNVITTVSELEGQKSFIPWSYEDIFKDILKELKQFKVTKDEGGGSPDDLRVRLDQIGRIMEITTEGLQAEIERISKIPGASEEANRIKDECLIRAAPHIEEIEVLLQEFKG